MVIKAKHIKHKPIKESDKKKPVKVKSAPVNHNISENTMIALHNLERAKNIASPFITALSRHICTLSKFSVEQGCKFTSKPEKCNECATLLAESICNISSTGADLFSNTKIPTLEDVASRVPIVPPMTGGSKQKPNFLLYRSDMLKKYPKLSMDIIKYHYNKL